MLLSDGTIKITDFGIARFARSETRTLTDKAIGSHFGSCSLDVCNKFLTGFGYLFIVAGLGSCCER